ESRRVETHHTTDEIAQMVARVCVVTDVGDTLRVEHFPTNCQNAFPNMLRNPGIKPVSDDKVEPSKSLGTCLTEIHRVEGDIPQTDLLHPGLPRSDRTPRQVQTDELTSGQLASHSDEVA